MNMHLAVRLCSFLTLLALVPSASDAGNLSLKKLGKLLDPTRVPVAIMRGQSPADVIGEEVATGTEAAGTIHDSISDAHRKTIGNALGPDWVRAYDTLHTGQNIGFEAALSGSRLLGHCLQGDRCTVEEITAAPLAAALRQAWKAYSPYGQPIPSAVQNVLNRAINPDFVASLRYVVGKLPDLSVPGMLNSHHEFFKQAHAVTIANIIIFSRLPNLNEESDWIWVIHEIRHSDQYLQLRANDTLFDAIDRFAVQYVRNYSAIERDAQRTAEETYDLLLQHCGNGSCQGQASADEPGYVSAGYEDRGKRPNERDWNELYDRLYIMNNERGLSLTANDFSWNAWRKCWARAQYPDQCLLDFRR